MKATLIVPEWIQREAAASIERSVRSLGRVVAATDPRRNPAQPGTLEHAYGEKRRFLDALAVIDAIAGPSCPALNRLAAECATRVTA